MAAAVQAPAGVDLLMQAKPDEPTKKNPQADRLNNKLRLCTAGNCDR